MERIRSKVSVGRSEEDNMQVRKAKRKVRLMILDAK